MSFFPYYPNVRLVDEWPGLSKREIIETFPAGTFDRASCRTRESLLRKLRELEPAMVGLLLENRLREKTAIRSVEGASKLVAPDDDERSGVDAILEDYRAFSVDTDRFLKIPSASTVKRCQGDYLHATSNHALARVTCQSCARWLWRSECVFRDMASVPNKQLLEPKHPHPAHELYDKMLVVPNELEFVVVNKKQKAYGFFCEDCMKHLRAANLPPLSLSNRMWVGQTPDALRGLTVPEQMLIALNYPRFFIYKLSPKGTHISDPSVKQRGLKGTVTTFPLNIVDIAKTLDGELLPRRLAVLSAVIGISFIGVGRVPKDALRGDFRVRRRWVKEALAWLTKNNKHYMHLKISEEMLDALPEDDIPQELLSIVRHEESADLADRECAGYGVDSDSEGEEEENKAREALGAFSDQEANNQQLEEEHADELSQRASTLEPDVIPLKVLGCIDSETGGMSNAQLIRAALERNEFGEEDGPYAVRHSWDAVSDFPAPAGDASGPGGRVNHIVSCYPTLFPYGEGGIEDERDVKVSYTEHARCLLRRKGFAFSNHHSFPFMVFSIIQKRQLLSSARLQMNQASFEANARLIQSLSLRDLKEAEDDETNKRFNTNPRVRALRNQIHATASRVMASNESRIAYRSQIWGMSLYMRPPSLWMTLNLSDTDEPVVQILCGERIDMNKFDKLAGPDPVSRARNVADNPLAAAEGFHFLMKTILETMIGVRRTTKTTKTSEGVLGDVSAYFGVVEAQGRGTLHLHMILWMENAPDTDEMQALLDTDEFRTRMKAYISEMICADIPGIETEEDLKKMKKGSHLAYDRPPNPSSVSFDSDRKRMAHELARAQQVHTCSTRTCLKFDRFHKLKCKRRAPFALADEAFVESDGSWGVRRKYGYFNSWCPNLICEVRANHDLKMTTNGRETRDGAFYVTNYATKGQERSYNRSAITAKAFLYHEEKLSEELTKTVKERNRLMLFRAVNLQNRQQELSGPQVMSYVMGWGDVFRSHNYILVYTSVLRRALERSFPGLGQTYGIDVSSGKSNGVGNVKGGTHGEENSRGVVNLEVGADEKLTSRSQVDDYRLRGGELEDFGYLSFFVNTYEDPRGGTNKGVGDVEHDTSSDMKKKAGRQYNDRVDYLEGHPQHRVRSRVVRTVGHNTLPSIVGPFFPRPVESERGENDLFLATALSLLKPWRSPVDLKGAGESWQSAFDTFMLHACRRDRDVVAGIRYYYQCSDTATRKQEESKEESALEEENGENPRRRRQRTAVAEDEDEAEEGGEDAEEALSMEDFDEEYLAQLIKSSTNEREDRHGREAVTIARLAGYFDDGNRKAFVGRTDKTARIAEGEDYQRMETWKAELARAGDMDKGEEAEIEEDAGDDVTGTKNKKGRKKSRGKADVVPFDSLKNRLKRLGEEGALEPTSPSSLLSEQRRVFDIITEHARAQEAGLEEKPLLMLVLGEGGVGKSKVIQTVTDWFASKGHEKELVKGSYTGIASSLIDGKTLHSLCSISASGSKKRGLSNAAKKAQEDMWRTKTHFIIDEVSMVSKSMLAMVERRLGVARAPEKADGEGIAAFGGMNVILFGDFHQFPPVAGKALYSRAIPEEEEDNAFGGMIYEQFQTVMFLTEQVRVTDPKWLDLLRRSRHGACTREQLEFLKTLVLGCPDGPVTDMSKPPWNDAVLITPRHGVRMRWNAMALEQHAYRTGNPIHVSVAEDTIDGRRLRMAERIAVHTKVGTSKSSRGGGRQDRAGLPWEVELAIGMKVMVIFNVDAELDLANGARGVIFDIILEDDEDAIRNDEARRVLKRPPACVLVWLDRTKAPQLPGLPEKVIPLFPMRKSFQITVGKARKTVWRRQLPMTGAYAFTDYRSQGQTVPYVIVDLAKPPTNDITSFGAYVALSRSHGAENVRLLRAFRESLFTTHPSQELREEEERLHVLAKKTKQDWDVRLGSGVLE